MGRQPLSRWQQFFQDDSKLKDIPPSKSARRAAKIFSGYGCRTVLDIGCGAGRDAVFLAQNGLRVVGLDAARSGLALARGRADAVSQEGILWVESDSRVLPVPSNSVDGVYCFGLLHEFVGETAENDVRRTMGEIRRVLKPAGVAVVAAAAGDPVLGLPHVQNFTEAMFDEAVRAFHCIEKEQVDDLGCTGRTDYKVWYGLFRKTSRLEK